MLRIVIPRTASRYEFRTIRNRIGVEYQRLHVFRNANNNKFWNARNYSFPKCQQQSFSEDTNNSEDNNNAGTHIFHITRKFMFSHSIDQSGLREDLLFVTEL